MTDDTPANEFTGRIAEFLRLGILEPLASDELEFLWSLKQDNPGIDEMRTAVRAFRAGRAYAGDHSLRAAVLQILDAPLYRDYAGKPFHCLDARERHAFDVIHALLEVGSARDPLAQKAVDKHYALIRPKPNSEQS